MNLFESDQASHLHSLQTIQLIEKYESYLMGIRTIYDMGCGSGKDAQYFLSMKYPSNGIMTPYQFKVVGIDVNDVNVRHNDPRLTFIKYDFEEYDNGLNADMIWSHDSFRFAIDPLKTLRNWWKILNLNGMLAIITPQTTNIHHGKPVNRTYPSNFYHYTITNLIYMLAVSGFDLRDNRFWKEPNDPWLHLIAYKGDFEPFQNPRVVTWYQLLDRLPDRWVGEVKKTGYLKEEVLQTHWINGQFCIWNRL